MKRHQKPNSADLLALIRKRIEQGRYLDTRHALDRSSEREITRPEILFVLRHGYHEKSKDRYEETFEEWNYAVRGKTPDGRDLRVIASFDEQDLIIITAIDLAKG